MNTNLCNKLVLYIFIILDCIMDSCVDFFFIYSLLLFCNQEKLGNKPYHTSTLWYADIFAKMRFLGHSVKFGNLITSGKSRTRIKWRKRLNDQVSCPYRFRVNAQEQDKEAVISLYTRVQPRLLDIIPFFPAIRSIYTRIYHFYGGNSLAWNKRLITLTYAHASDFW